MVKVKRKARSCTTTKSKSESTCCECNSVFDDNSKGVHCERCGDSDGTWKCHNCMSVTESFFDELINLPVNNTLHWFCNKCEKAIMKCSGAGGDLAVGSVLQLLTHAMDKINNLESMMRASQHAATDFETKVMNRIESTEHKLQVLVDVNFPPVLNDKTFDDTQTVDHESDENKSGDADEAALTAAAPVQPRTGWSELFHRVSEVAAVRAVKEATIVVNKQPVPGPIKEDDSVGRSVVVYGLPESRSTNDTLAIDHLVKQLDSSLSVESHRRLRRKSADTDTAATTTTTKPPPLLVVLSTVFDQRKILSLARNLKSHGNYKAVFIKKALSVTEMQDVNELRRKCTAANEILSKNDPLLESKFAVIDGKIRRLVKITDSDKYKVEWSAVVSLSDLPKNLL